MLKGDAIMDEFNSETDSDYTSYWRDWVSSHLFQTLRVARPRLQEATTNFRRLERTIELILPRWSSCHCFYSDIVYRKASLVDPLDYY